MKQSHYLKIAGYREKLKEVYTVDVKYNQPVTGLYAHYNRIVLMLKPDYEEWDFRHELMHLEFLTQEIRIKYLYPKREFFGERERFLLSNAFVNIIYDLYVDVYLAEKRLAPLAYFRKKEKIFAASFENLEQYYPLPPLYLDIIKKGMEEYLAVLKAIRQENTAALAYLKKNDIVSQREHINEYLRTAQLEDEFEWITYHTLYVREQEEANDRST